MNVVFISHYFYPEGNAPANRVYEMTRRWAGDGHRVTVITGVPNVPSGVVYEGYKNRWRQEEVVEGVHVIRVKTYIAANAGRVRRILSFLSFMITASIAGLRVDRQTSSSRPRHSSSVGGPARSWLDCGESRSSSKFAICGPSRS